MQEVWLRASLWLHGGYRHIHERRHIEKSICVSFDYTFNLLLQAYLGFFVLETEVIDMDRKKKGSFSESAALMLLYKSKSPVPGFTDQCSLLLLGVRRGLPLRGKSCSNGRLLTTPTLLGSPSSACCEKVAAYLVALRRQQIGRHQIRLSIPCKGFCPPKWRQQRIHGPWACRWVVLNVSASWGASKSWDLLWWKRVRGGSSCCFLKYEAHRLEFMEMLQGKGYFADYIIHRQILLLLRMP